MLFTTANLCGKVLESGVKGIKKGQNTYKTSVMEFTNN